MTGRLATAASSARGRIADAEAPAFALAALTTLGLAIRLVGFGESLFGDELSTYAAASMADGPGGVIDLITGDQSVVELTPPLYFLLAWASLQLGDSIELIRLPSLIAGTMLIPAVYVLGSRTIGRTAAMLAAALTTISPFLVFYSSDGRAYTLATLLVVVAAISLLRATAESGSRAWWAAYALAACAAMYSHYTAVFPLAVLAAWSLWAHRDRWVELVVASALAALAYVPWLPEYLDDSRSPFNLTEALHPFGVESMLGDFADWSVGMPPLTTLETVPGTPALVAIVAGFAVAIAGLGWRALALGADEPPKPSPGLVLVIGLGLAAPVGMSLYSALGDDILYSRVLAVSTPGLALAAAALLIAARPPASVVASLLVVGGFALGLANSLTADARPDYEAAADFIEAETTSADSVYDATAFGSREGPLATALAVQMPDRIVETPEDVGAATAGSETERIAVLAIPSSVDIATLVPPEYTLRAERRFEGVFELGAFVFERSGAGG